MAARPTDWVQVLGSRHDRTDPSPQERREDEQLAVPLLDDHAYRRRIVETYDAAGPPDRNNSNVPDGHCERHPPVLTAPDERLELSDLWGVPQRPRDGRFRRCLVDPRRRLGWGFRDSSVVCRRALLKTEGR